MSERQAEDLARWDYEQKRAIAERLHDREAEFIHRANEAAVTAGNNALRALILINGGAAVAMLAFIGHLVSADKVRFTAKLVEMTSPLVWFALGVVLATLGIGFAYITNYSHGAYLYRKEWNYIHPYIKDTPSSRRWGISVAIFQVLALFAAAFSLIFFVCGVMELRSVISALK